MKKKYIILFAIVLVGVFLRFYKLGQIPAGFHQDEVSQAYNAFSILETGKDRYGESFPILFRSFGSYQPPVYTYLTTVSIFIFGNTTFAAAFMSALFGSLTIILTFFIVRILANDKYSEKLALFSSAVIAISPWAIHFSRRVVEANVGLFFFLLAFFFLLKSLSKIKYFPLAAFVMGVATHAYYSERVIGLIFFFIFILIFRRYFLKNIKILLIGIIIFGLTLIPHIITVLSGAFASRFEQVRTSGGGSPIVEFIKHLVSYFSPRNLFSDLGSDLGRISPGIGVFYDWFFIPFLAGIVFFRKIFKKKYIPLFGILLFLTLIPAALTGDVFYPLRTLDYFWLISIIVSMGLISIFQYIKPNILRTILFFVIAFYSLLSLYVSYFVLFYYETNENVGQSYLSLIQELDKYKDYTIVIDNPRDTGMGLRIAYFKEFDPRILQNELRPQMVTNYYSSYVNQGERYVIGNVTTRMVDWTNDPCNQKIILVGDVITFSDSQIKEHRLTELFTIKSVNENFTLRGFGTNPPKRCRL